MRRQLEHRVGFGRRASRAYCERCPVTAECIESGTASPLIQGNWAGTTSSSRRKLRKGAKVA